MEEQTAVDDKHNEIYNEIREVLNKYSRENASNTPDYILGEYLLGCLEAFEHATRRRDNWYGGKHGIIAE